MVLTQPERRPTPSRSIARVSIPLWFLRNGNMMLSSGDLFGGFHTTMVLTQLSWRLSKTFSLSSFHTTMVLTQPAIDGVRYASEHPFPYHYGSYATMGKCRD